MESKTPYSDGPVPNKANSSPKKPPFKLCFPIKIEPGRSKICPYRSRNYVHIVTGKFYKPQVVQVSPEVLGMVVKEYEQRDKEHQDVLESQRLGRYKEVNFETLATKNDPRLNFHYCTDDLFTYPIK